MFRLIRMMILVFLAFAAGIMVGRGQAQSICASGDGEWRQNTCVGSDILNG